MTTESPIWSEHQLAIFNEIETGTSSLVIEAVAGSGKTTTLVELCKRIPRGRSSVALAFNKAMAETLQAKMPYWVQSRTFHSHCYEALKASLPKAPRVDFKKVGNTFEAIAKNDRDFYKHVGALTKLVGYAKSSGLIPNDPAQSATDEGEWQQWADLIDYFDVDTEDANELIRYAQATLEASNALLTSVDFDDMLYLTLLRNVPFARCDFVLVDEAQDLNGVQRKLLGRMIKGHHFPWPKDCRTIEDKEQIAILDKAVPPGRLIAVGDPHQAIYGFRGADADGMEKITEAFGAKVLPLSVSYRCSRSVVDEANRVLNGNSRTASKRLGYGPNPCFATSEDGLENHTEEDDILNFD